MRRLSAAAALALVAVAAWPSGAAEPKLTPRNSVVAPLVVSDRISIDGVGCNVPASATVPLPAGAFDARVKRPSVGARSRSLDERVTNVSVQGNAVTFTAIADAGRVCDPNEEATPPANRPWSGEFDVEVGFRLRVGVVYRNIDQVRRARLVRPREVHIGVLGPAARRIRWRQFGGRKAVGFGVSKSLTPCPGGCGNGTRLRVELTRPGRCPGVKLPGHKEDAVLYGQVAFVPRERRDGRRVGFNRVSRKMLCSTAGDGPIPVR